MSICVCSSVPLRDVLTLLSTNCHGVTVQLLQVTTTLLFYWFDNTFQVPCVSRRNTFNLCWKFTSMKLVCLLPGHCLFQTYHIFGDVEMSCNSWSSLALLKWWCEQDHSTARSSWVPISLGPGRVDPTCSTSVHPGFPQVLRPPPTLNWDTGEVITLDLRWCECEWLWGWICSPCEELATVQGGPHLSPEAAGTSSSPPAKK